MPARTRRLRCGLTVEVRGGLVRHWKLTGGRWLRLDLRALD